MPAAPPQGLAITDAYVLGLLPSYNVVLTTDGVVRVQAELEDQILQLLSSATGSLLDNIQLINTLDASKTTWEQVNQSLQVCLPHPSSPLPHLVQHAFMTQSAAPTPYKLVHSQFDSHTARVSACCKYWGLPQQSDNEVEILLPESVHRP